jgi:hypothetical protein
MFATVSTPTDTAAPGRRLVEQVFGVNSLARIGAMGLSTRFRCGSCGNLTRFDVVESRRTRSFYHYTVGGELQVEEEEVLEGRRESVTCRWCGSSDRIEEIPLEDG